MIYFRYIRMVILSQMQYRASTWLTIVAQFLSALFAYLSMSLLFERFGNVRGFTFPEAALCFSVTMTAFAITECVARGFDMFRVMITQGEFDRVMLRPRSTILQVLGSSFELSRVGRLFQSLFVMALAVSQLPVPLTPLKALVLILMVLCGVVVFAGIFMLGAAVCFFTVQGLEVINIFTDGGREFASYPLPIYDRWIVRVFTFVIPFGCFNYLPLLYVMGRAEGRELLYMAMPLIGMLFIVPCVWAWNFGVRHYLSAGS